MPNAAYLNLRERLAQTVEQHPLRPDEMSLYQSVVDRMDAMVMPSSTASSIGYLFVSSFLQECTPLHQSCSPGIEAIAKSAFKWTIAYEDWSSAAWMMCVPCFNIALPPSQHPNHHILHALVCNDSMDWPHVYQAALTTPSLVLPALAKDVPEFCTDDDALQQSISKYVRQIRKACYFGPAEGLYGTDIAIRWLHLHHEHSMDVFPVRMGLRHAHPQEDELTRLLQNQWCVDQFWITRDASYLNRLSGLHLNDFQSWFWLLGAQSSRIEPCPVWITWWANHQEKLVEHAMFWMKLHMQIQGLNAHTLRKPERLLVVRDAMGFALRQPQERFELPEEYLEIPREQVYPQRLDGYR